MKENIKNRRPSNLILESITLITVGILLFSCSDGVDEKIINTHENAYILVSLSLADETRSETITGGGSDAGVETGTDNENSLNTVDLYFHDGTEIIFQRTGLQPIRESGNGQPTYTVKSQIIAEDFANLLANKKVDLYVVGNATASNITGTLSEANLSYTEIKEYGDAGQSIPMSNKTKSTLDFSTATADEIKEMFTLSNSEATLDLSSADLESGVISLERTWARLDYKDAERGGSTGLPSAENVFQLGSSGLYLKVEEMMPVNVSKSCYLFRHTAASKGTASLFGTEGGNPYNWIADNDWTTKTTLSGPPDTNYFLNQPVKSGTIWTLSGIWTALSELTGSDNYGNKEYHPWCYISENTLPSVDKMIEGLSTGVAFRVILCKEDGTALTAAELSETAGVRYDSATSTLSVGSESRLVETVNGNLALIYYYWIRHNDSSNSVAVTDPMEFAVVRNNIYKLSISKFNSLPRLFNPEDPDEAPEDIELKVAVSPWNYFSINLDI